MRTFLASQLATCSRKCLKSFVICARSSHDVRDVCKIFVKLQTDSESFENVSRMSRESSEVRPIIYPPIHELFAYFLRTGDFAKEANASLSRRGLILIRLPLDTINLRMSRSIHELFAGYTRPKTDAFTYVWRRFCAHDILTKFARCSHECLAHVFRMFGGKSAPRDVWPI